MKRVLRKEVRKYIYGVAIAFIPVAVWFDWLDAEATPIILPLILAILNLTPDDDVDVEVPNAAE